MHGVETYWNLLYGFPSETLEDYAEQHRLIKMIPHLEPPIGVSRIRIDRFSPNFEDPSLRAQFASIKPLDAYVYTYPDVLEYDRAAYFFSGSAPSSIRDRDIREVVAEVEAWNRKWGRRIFITTTRDNTVKRPYLWSEADPDGVLITDGRTDQARPIRFVLSALEGSIYSAIFETPASVEWLSAKLGHSKLHLEECMERFDRTQLAYRVGDIVLALALSPTPSRRADVLEATPPGRPA